MESNNKFVIASNTSHVHVHKTPYLVLLQSNDNNFRETTSVNLLDLSHFDIQTHFSPELSSCDSNTNDLTVTSNTDILLLNLTQIHP